MLGDPFDALSADGFHPLPVIVGYWAKATNVEGLQHMSCMGWEAEWQDVVIKTKPEESFCEMASMSIHDEKTVLPLCFLSSHWIKTLFQPLRFQFVVGVAIWAGGKMNLWIHTNWIPSVAMCLD